MKHDTIIITDKGKSKHQSLIDKLVRDLMLAIESPDDETPFEVVMKELEGEISSEDASEIESASIEVEEDE